MTSRQMVSDWQFGDDDHAFHKDDDVDLEERDSHRRASSPAATRAPRIGFFTASDGYRLHYRHWQPATGEVKGRIVALHGIQSHSGWYGWSSAQLCDAGYEVLFLDRRGSGLNEVDRGHAQHHDRLLNDVVQFLGHVRGGSQNADRTRLILLSVSWGAKLAALTAARQPELLDGLALLYPGIRAKIGARAGQNMQLGIAKSTGGERIQVTVPLADPALFTGDFGWQEFIRTDPLTLRKVTVSFLAANRRLDRLLLDAPEAIRCPTLMMLAGGDDIVDNRATRGYFLRFASDRRKLIEYLDSRHTLEFEPRRDDFLADLLVWLDTICCEQSDTQSLPRK